MTNRDPEKLNKLLKQNWRRRRVPELVERWAALGISVSAIAPDRHWKLIDRLRGGLSLPLQYVDDLATHVHAFVGASDVVTILGWDVEYEPALLISSEGLLRTMPSIDEVYPDGFVLINEADSTALFVDIDEDEGVQANKVDMPA